MRSATRPAPTSARCRSRAKRCCGRCGRRRSAVELLRPSSPEEAAAALRDGRIALAGGTDLVPRGGKRWGSAGASIGAGTTLAELEADTEIPAVLREACAAAASPQLRN